MADYVGSEDAGAVRLIKAEGGIPFVKTNNPQIVFALETVNTIYGLALNPHNLKRTCGGSSGGEGGLISSQCSILGLGTDIGGSIRAPAAFCGIYGFRPSPGRISYDGVIVPVPDGHNPQSPIESTVGPLARNT